jgi:DNA-binding response OmpR family regulator
LIVEDDELLRDMYVAKFELEGYSVETAGDGLAGLDAALHTDPDLIILDNLMPHLTGLELLARFRAAQPERQPVVVFLSNKSSPADVAQAKQLGAADYLIKSHFTPRDLIKKVQTLMNSDG